MPDRSILFVDIDRPGAAAALRAGLEGVEHAIHDFDVPLSVALERLDVGKMRSALLNHLLLKRDNVVFTPHLAFNSREANQRIFETTTENIRRFLEGRPQNLGG
jgi:hypothetical protein